MVEVTGCQTGASRFAGLADRVRQAGAGWSTAECFDRCEVCERALLAKVDGALMRFSSVDELIEAVVTLGAE